MPGSDQLEMRSVTSDEFLVWARAVMVHFHEDDSDEELERHREVTELDRTLAVFDGDRIVANLGVDSFSCTVPFADPLPCAGVTAVGVASTHRRRGLLNRMMTRCLEDAVDRGEPLASLYASEAAIYGRFGFGVAAVQYSYRLAQSWFTLAAPADVGLVEAVDADAAAAAWPAIFDAVRCGRPGMMSSSPERWRLWLGNDPDSWRDGASARRLVQVPGRGYAAYRLKPDWGDAGPDGTIKVEALLAVDAEAEAALWQFLFGIDLMARLEAKLRPADDALPLMLVHRDRLRVREGEPLYLRVLDVPAALTGRGYAGADTLVLEVRDRQFIANDGRWRLAAGRDGAKCDRTDEPADLELDIADLASAYVGGVRTTQLVAARRVREPTAGAAARADRLFAADAAPWTPFIF